jgi:sec-independent protein translocase protein TatB
MFDVSSSEFLLVMVIALVVIGPKDLPKVLRFVGKWVGKGRAVAAQFRSGLDDMVRQSELEELEKKWKAENDRIMAQSASPSASPSPSSSIPEHSIVGDDVTVQHSTSGETSQAPEAADHIPAVKTT